MEIKYEPVFGPQELFNGTMDDCEFASEEYGYSFANGRLYYCERYNEKAGWSLSCKSHLTFKPSAMRRIIAEPKRWTLEDKKAGRLPEVGCLVVNKTGKVSEVVTIKNGYFVLFECGKNNGPLTIHGDLLMNQFKPIETPEEKAQREEDEFVASVIDLASENQLMSCGFKDGVIAAYRKLKGGE